MKSELLPVRQAVGAQRAIAEERDVGARDGEVRPDVGDRLVKRRLVRKEQHIDRRREQEAGATDEVQDRGCDVGKKEV